MHWQISLDVLILILSGILSTITAIGLWGKRRSPGAIYLFVMLIAGAIWCLTAAFEHASNSASLQILATKIQYIGSFALAPAYLLFALALIRSENRFSFRTHLLIWSIPVLTVTLAFSNEYHGLIWTGFTWLEENGRLIYHHGVWFGISVIYSYGILLAGSILIFKSAVNQTAISKKQVFTILLAILIPWVANLTYITNIFPIPGIDPTPFAFAVSNILLAISIYLFRLFSITPIARDKVIDKMNDLVIVLDAKLHIVDLNPAALTLFDVKRSEAIGVLAIELLKYWPYLERILLKGIENITFVKTIQDIHGQWYRLRISPLQDRNENQTGWLILMQDITEEKQKDDEVRRLASIVETANESIVLTNIDGKILYVNPYFEKVTGYSAEEALGENPRILKSGAQADDFYEAMWKLISSGQAWEGRFINKRKDGSLYHEAGTIFPIKNSEGKISNYAAVKRDITGQVMAEQALQNFSEKLTFIHEINIQLSEISALDDICRIAVQSGLEKLGFERLAIWLIDMNDPAYLCGMYGTDEQGNIRDERKHRFLTSRIEQDIFSSHKERVLHLENYLLRNERSEIVGKGDLISVSLWDDQKAIGYLVADSLFTGQSISQNQQKIFLLFAQVVANQITRKRYEENIQDSERQYRLLADNATDVIWTMNLQGHFTYISPSVKQMRGFTPEEVLGQSIAESLTPTSNEIAAPIFENIIQTVQTGEQLAEIPIYELEQPCKDGSTIWVEIITSIMYDDNGEALGILGVTRDITERKKAETATQLHAKRMALLNEITQAAIQQTDFDEMLQTLADRLGDLLGADGCYITLWDEKTQSAIPAAAFGPSRDTYRTDGVPQSGEPTLTESALKHGHVLVISDVFNTSYLSPRIAAKFPARSGLALPLIANNQKLGAALIAFNTQREYTQAEIEISQQAAQQIALAVLKSRLLEEAEQRAKEAETLRLASAAIVTTLEQEQAIERILEELNQVVPYDSASVLMIRDFEMVIVGARGFKNPKQILGLKFAVKNDTPNKVVFETRQPYIIDDAPTQYEAFKKEPHNHIRGWMGIPLMIRENLIGMLALDSQQPGRFSQDHARLANAFADQVAIALENARLFEETRRLAITDSLTNLYNRRHFMELARREFERTVRHKTPLSIIMLDIDRFKKINDTYGHLVGDQVLQTAAYICRKNIRSIDFIGRYGGEEFVILLPDTPLVGHPKNEDGPNDKGILPAERVAERIRQRIAEAVLEIGENSIAITVSLGVAEYNPISTSIENVIDYADRALLQAKSRGRNIVYIWKSEENLA